MKLDRHGRWLYARFDEPCMTLSWAIVGGGLQRSLGVAWHEITDDELQSSIDAAEFLRARMSELGLFDSVGLLTSRQLDAYVQTEQAHAGLSAQCVATVGMSNALRAGDPPGSAARAGTINLLCHVSVPLSFEAALEALAVATEARTLAVREAGLASTQSGEPASGTGTDCIVIAAPERGQAEHYAGKHTPLGHVVGRSVHDAVAQGVACWQAEQEARGAVAAHRDQRGA
jgi:adenosylcobinamide amidohydrolase